MIPFWNLFFPLTDELLHYFTFLFNSISHEWPLSAPHRLLLDFLGPYCLLFRLLFFVCWSLHFIQTSYDRVLQNPFLFSVFTALVISASPLTLNITNRLLTLRLHTQLTVSPEFLLTSHRWPKTSQVHVSKAELQLFIGKTCLPHSSALDRWWQLHPASCSGRAPWNYLWILLQTSHLSH